MKAELSPAEVAWIKKQIERPAPLYLLSDLLRLCGPNLGRRRLYRMLLSKQVIQKGVGKGRDHIIPFSRLLALWPELWFSIRRAWQETQIDNDPDMKTG